MRKSIVTLSIVATLGLGVAACSAPVEEIEAAPATAEAPAEAPAEEPTTPAAKPTPAEKAEPVELPGGTAIFMQSFWDALDAETQGTDCTLHASDPDFLPDLIMGEVEGETFTLDRAEVVRFLTDACASLDETASDISVSAQNAMEKAESYLEYSGFSRKGLIGQLEYEGFSTADSTYAADNVDVDWNEECAEKAQSYMDSSSFSKSGLADQLDYEGFSDSQIAYGLKAVGY